MLADPSNVVGRLTKTKLDKLRSYASTDAGSNFTIDFWSYTKTPLRQSLTLIHNPVQEETAIKMFNCILIYSGIEESCEFGEGETWVILSSLFLLGFSCLCFLRLIHGSFSAVGYHGWTG